MTGHSHDVEQGQTAYRHVDQLVRELRSLVDRDPDQEVWGIAVPVLDEVLGWARTFVADNPVVGRMTDVVSVSHIADDQTVRAADALIVATQLRTALHKHMPLPGI
jgi:hypothetical protein